jgi:hypothetical protein
MGQHYGLTCLNAIFPLFFYRVVDVWASICGKKGTDSLPELFDYVKSKQTICTQPGRGIFPVFDASGCELEDNTVRWMDLTPA